TSSAYPLTNLDGILFSGLHRCAARHSLGDDMNKQHLEYCSSDEWADAVKRYIIPAALEGVELGDEVLEVGPGPGRTTEVLQTMTRRMTAAEIDHDLAHALGTRLRDGSARVVNADGTALPFASGRFSAALSFPMLHH